MKKRIDKISLRAPATLLWLLITALVVNLTSCETEASIEDYMVKHDAVYDPTQPVTITSFSPEGGPVATQIIIYGTNFGSDPSIIKVTIDDVEMPVISSDGTRAYIILGSVLEEDDDKGVLTVYVGEDEEQQKAVAEKLFKFRNEPYVTTLAGWKDEKGNSASEDGPINEAQFGNLCRVYLDKENNIFIAQEAGQIRFIPNDHSYVTTIYEGNSTINHIWSLSFDPDYSRILFTNYKDDNKWTTVGLLEIPYSNDVNQGKQTAKGLANIDRSYSGAFHPKDNVFFYASQRDGIVFKWDLDADDMDGKKHSEELFRVKERSTQLNICFHPDGEFAYLVSPSHHQILKSKYDKDKKILLPATVFAGSKKGYEDGVGTSARFEEPHQGCFDENGDFYVGENKNHTIRKITPNGIVTTFVGIGNSSGYIDGTFKDAKFSEPQGIAYDKERRVFYVADRANRVLRMIVLPHEESVQ